MAEAELTLSLQIIRHKEGTVGKVEPYRLWSAYVRNVAIWLLVAIVVSAGTVLGIFKGIFLVMDHFLQSDRFYDGFAFSLVVSACGTAILFVIIMLLVRQIGKYPRRKLKGIRGL